MKCVAIAIVLLFIAIPVRAGEGNSDVGKVAFSNTGSAAAQPAFLRGMALLHSFEYEDAAVEFRKAQDLDPGFAPAYWGEAMTYNHPIWMEQDRDAALAALKRLGPTPEARMSRTGTQREKDYLQAVEVLYGEGNKDDRDFAYSEAMRLLHEKNPADPEAASFYALSILGTAHHGRDFAVYMRAAAVLEEVYRDYPDHPGIAHYLIHSYDDPIHAPLGLRPARVYAGIAPAASHAQHMTSHIFLALGMWNDVVSSNENASRVVNERRKRDGKPPRFCGHYNFWLLYGYLQQGRTDQAKAILSGCRETAMSDTAKEEHHPGMMQMMDPDRSEFGSFVQMWARYILETDDWEGTVSEWEIPIKTELNAQITYHWVAGMRAVHRQNLSQAENELVKLRDAQQKQNAYVAEKKSEDDSYIKRAEILEKQLKAVILIASKRTDEGFRLLQETADREESLPMEFGPPFIDKPTRELLGEVLLQHNRPQEAVSAFEAALQRAPNRTLSVRGLASAAPKNQK